MEIKLASGASAEKKSFLFAFKSSQCEAEEN
jgi:hypothetical protein